MPCLKTSFESDAPMVTCAWHLSFGLFEVLADVNQLFGG